MLRNLWIICIILVGFVHFVFLVFLSNYFGYLFEAMFIFLMQQAHLIVSEREPHLTQGRNFLADFFNNYSLLNALLLGGPPIVQNRN